MTLQNDVKSVSKYLTKKQKDFDRVMDLTRDTIREAAQTISMLHNDDKTSAKKRLGRAYKNVKTLKKFDEQFEYHSRQSYQEYAEAKIFFDIKTKNTVPNLSEVGVS